MTGRCNVETEPARMLVVEAIQGESERRYRALIEQSPDAIVVHDEHGRVLYANAAALSMVGKHSIEEVKDDDIFACLPREQHDLIRSGIQRVLEGEALPPISMPMSLPDGSIIQVDVNAGLVQYNGCRAVQAVLRDVTARNKTELALRESEARNRILVEMSPDGILIHQDGVIIYANPAAIDLLKAGSEHDVVGRDIISIVRSGFQTKVKEYSQLDLEGVTTPPMEVHLQCCDGTTTVVEGRGARIVVNGRPAVQVHLRDITERKRIDMRLEEYAETLKRSNEDLERFAYVSSHDLQEPLRTVVTFTQLLKRRYHGQIDANADEYIQFIVEAGSRMQLLINDLLEFSRVTTKGCELQRIASEVVLEQTLASLHATIEETGSIITHDPLPPVMADAIQLQEVFLNLIANGIKFGRDGVPPRIHIAAEPCDGMIRFSVSDNGIGIEPEYYDRVATTIIATPALTQTSVPTPAENTIAARNTLRNQWTLIQRAQNNYNNGASRWNATDPFTLQNPGINYMRENVIPDVVDTISKAKSDLVNVTSIQPDIVAERDLLIGICDYKLFQMDGNDKTYQGLQVAQYDPRRAKTIYAEAKSSLQKATNIINGLSITQQYEAFVQADITRIEAAISRVNGELAQLPS